MANPVFDVVKFIVRAGDLYDDGDSITNMKLQKLLYYFQGFHLAEFEGKPLFSEAIHAWEHGPVVPSVWRKFTYLGRWPIEIAPEAMDVDSFTQDQVVLMADVYDVYGQYSAWKLRNMTHEEPPWRNTWNNGAGRDDVIPHDSLREYFTPLLTHA